MTWRLPFPPVNSLNRPAVSISGLASPTLGVLGKRASWSPRAPAPPPLSLPPWHFFFSFLFFVHPPTSNSTHFALFDVLSAPSLVWFFNIGAWSRQIVSPTLCRFSSCMDTVRIEFHVSNSRYLSYSLFFPCAPGTVVS